MIDSTIHPAGEMLTRDRYLSIVRSAIAFREFRFARQMTVNWLTSFSGDLPFRYTYAQILQKEGHPELALPILDEITLHDPEYLDAVEARYRIEYLLQTKNFTGNNISAGNQNDPYHPSQKSINLVWKNPGHSLGTLQWLIALRGVLSPSTPKLASTAIIDWGKMVFQTRQTLTQAAREKFIPGSDEELIDQQFLNSLAQQPGSPIVIVTHLQLMRSKVEKGTAPPQLLDTLAEHYFRLTPDCLQVALIYAERLLERGQSEKAVSLLHRCASKDITGQVSTRLWGSNHPYRNLYPERLERRLDLPVPARVVAYFGWNQLQAGELDELNLHSIQEDKSFLPDTTSTDNTTAIETEPIFLPEDLQREPLVDFPGINSASYDHSEIESQPGDQKTISAINLTPGFHENEFIDVHNGFAEQSISQGATDSLQDIRDEFERIGKRLQRPDLGNADARSPVYVIMTTHQGLLDAYGDQNTKEIEADISRLLQAVSQSSQWRAIVYYPDQGLVLPSTTFKASINTTKVEERRKHDDPWSLKLALTDLDAILAQHGETIGALLIVGGPEIVPFHFLPNPVDDMDEEVPSDNPYATRDENYFYPEWPVGRLPGASRDDGSFLRKILQSLTEAHFSRPPLRVSRQTGWGILYDWLRSILPTRLANGRGIKSFGYTAAAWRLASFQVFRPIGEAKSMLISPKLSAETKTKPAPQSKKYWPRFFMKTKKTDDQVVTHPTTTPGIQVPSSCLGYFNLHGLQNSPSWYGQKDHTEPGLINASTEDYPVALQPQDIGVNGQHAPIITFSEACFGAYIHNKQPDQALALRFLEKGCQAFIGSTCISYGALNAELTAADLLGRAFWGGIRQGLTAGECFRRAKFQLANEMLRRQGYLDGEDQKTLISFVFYGDPLALPIQSKPLAKGFLRFNKPNTIPLTICDHSSKCSSDDALTPEAIQQVKKVVHKYLPGMKGARMTIRTEKCISNPNCPECGSGIQGINQPKNTSNDDRNNRKEILSGRKLIVLSKSASANGREHKRYARLTINEQGKVIKLVVSR